MRIPQITVVLIACALPMPRAALAESQCVGHQLLATPRPEASCATIVAKIHPSPDRKLHAVVLPADISLNTTPDMESRVVIRSVAGDTLNSLQFGQLSDMIGGRPLLSEKFQFSGEHMLTQAPQSRRAGRTIPFPSPSILRPPSTS